MFKSFTFFLFLNLFNLFKSQSFLPRSENISISKTLILLALNVLIKQWTNYFETQKFVYVYFKFNLNGLIYN